MIISKLKKPIVLNARSIAVFSLAGMLVTASAGVRQQPSDKKLPVPSHADAAIIFAKYSGLFDRYVSDKTSLDECVAFLNKTGIYFGLLEVLNKTEFTLHDCARVMGQMNLVFSGEAEYSSGKVRLPEGIESWEGFCILNDVKYVQGYQNLCATMALLYGFSDID